MNEIKIKPENRGKFTAIKKRTGKTTEELTHSKNPLTRKRAIFAQNAKKWKHEEGGIVTPYGQWEYPGEVTIIPSNEITMDGVNYPVVGISNIGERKLMLPWMNYKFNGDYVTEYPLKAQRGIHYDFVSKYLPMIQSELSNYSDVNDSLAKNLLYQMAQESQYGTRTPNHTNFWGIKDPGKETYRNFGTLENGLKYWIQQIHDNYPDAWKANDTIEYAKGLTTGKNNMRYMSADPNSYMQNMLTLGKNYDLYLQNQKKLEGSFVPLPTVDNKITNYSSAMAKGLFEGNNIANIVGTTLGAASTLASGIGGSVMAKKQDNTESVNKYGGMPFTQAIIEGGEIVDYPDGTQLIDTGEQHEYSGERTYRPNGKIDGDPVEFTGIPIVDLKNNPNLKLLSLGANPWAKGEPFIWPSTVNQKGYVNTKVDRYFPEAHNKNELKSIFNEQIYNSYSFIKPQKIKKKQVGGYNNVKFSNNYFNYNNLFLDKIKELYNSDPEFSEWGDYNNLTQSGKNFANTNIVNKNNITVPYINTVQNTADYISKYYNSDVVKNRMSPYTDKIKKSFSEIGYNYPTSLIKNNYDIKIVPQNKETNEYHSSYSSNDIIGTEDKGYIDIVLGDTKEDSSGSLAMRVGHEMAHANPIFNYRNWAHTLEPIDKVYNSEHYGNNYSFIPNRWRRLLTPKNPNNSHDSELNENYSDLVGTRADLYNLGLYDSTDSSTKATRKILRNYRKTDEGQNNRYLQYHSLGKTKRALNHIAQFGGLIQQPFKKPARIKRK